MCCQLILQVKTYSERVVKQKTRSPVEYEAGKIILKEGTKKIGIVMKIYEIVKTEKEEGLFSSHDNDVVDWWTLTPPAEAKIVEMDGDEEYDILYAITYDTDEMSTEELMEIMYTELALDEVKKICAKDKWINSLYLNYLKNPLNNKKVKKKIQKAIESTNATSSTVSGGIMASLILMESLIFMANIFH